MVLGKEEEYMFLTQPRLQVDCVRGRMDTELNVHCLVAKSFSFFLTTTTTI